MAGWRRYLLLNAEAKTGLSRDVVATGLVAIAMAPVALALLIFSVFIALAQRYSPLIAAVALALAFLSLAIVAGGLCVSFRRTTMRRTALALASTSSPIEPFHQNLSAAARRVRDLANWQWMTLLVASGTLVAVGLVVARYKSQAQDDELYR
jgi:hypothetical protein